MLTIKNGVLIGADSLIGRTLRVPAGVRAIQEDAFAERKDLRHLVLPATLRDIGDNAFSNSALETVTFAEGLATIGDYAFHNTHIHEALLPDSLCTIGASAFKGCGQLANVRVPDTLLSLGSSAFSSTRWLMAHAGETLRVCGGRYLLTIAPARTLMIPDGVTEVRLSHMALHGQEIERIVLPGSVTSIGYGSFAGIETLREVQFPAHLRVIEAQAFSGCSALARAVLPGSIERVGMDAFAGCHALGTLSVPITARMQVGSTDRSTAIELRWAGGTFTVLPKVVSKVMLFDALIRFLRVDTADAAIEALHLMEADPALHDRCTFVTEWRFPDTFMPEVLARAAAGAAIACAAVGDIPAISRIMDTAPLDRTVLTRCLEALPKGRTDLRAAALALIEGQSGETLRRL